MELQVFGIILSVILGAAATVTSSMVLLNLRTMNRRIDKLEQDQKTLISRKDVCNQHYVDKVTYIRSINSQEEGIKLLIEKVAMLNGSMKVIEQMPAICGNIAKEIAKEMKSHG